MKNDSIKDALLFLKANRDALTRRQITTIRGQILHGDVDGAVRGIERIVEKKRGAKL